MIFQNCGLNLNTFDLVETSRSNVNQTKTKNMNLPSWILLKPKSISRNFIMIMGVLSLLCETALAQSFTEHQKIVASDRSSNNMMGNVVAISGNIAVCGAFGNEFDELGLNPMNQAGLFTSSVEVYQVNGSKSKKL